MKINGVFAFRHDIYYEKGTPAFNEALERWQTTYMLSEEMQESFRNKVKQAIEARYDMPELITEELSYGESDFGNRISTFYTGILGGVDREGVFHENENGRFEIYAIVKIGCEMWQPPLSKEMTDEINFIIAQAMYEAGIIAKLKFNELRPHFLYEIVNPDAH